MTETTRRIHDAMQAGRADAVLTDDMRQRYASHDLDRRARAVTTWQGMVTASIVHAAQVGTDAAVATVQARTTELELSYLLLAEAV